MNSIDKLKVDWRAVAELRSSRAGNLIAFISFGLAGIPWVFASSHHLLADSSIAAWVVGIAFPVLFIFFSKKIGDWFESIPDHLFKETKPI